MNSTVSTPIDASRRQAWVCGHDGSSEAEHALEWAARLAAVRGADIELVRVWQYPFAELLPASSWSSGTELAQEIEQSVDTELKVTAGAAMERHPIAIEASVVLGRPADALLDAAVAADAELLVVGSRRLGPFARFALGSVSHRVATHATMPLAIVPDIGSDGLPERVIVGIDGSVASMEALRWAHHFVAPEADIVAVHVWSGTGIADPQVPGPIMEDLRVEARNQVGAQIDQLAAELGSPGRFDYIFARGHAGQVLADLAEDADLLVVGARGQGGVVGFVVGSVASWLIHHLVCPTVIVPAPEVTS